MDFSLKKNPGANMWCNLLKHIMCMNSFCNWFPVYFFNIFTTSKCDFIKLKKKKSLT